MPKKNYGKLPKIEKHGNQYRAHVSTGRKVDGKYERLLIVGDTEDEVARRLLDFKLDREAAEEETRTGNITFAAAMEAFIASCRTAKRSPRTIKEYVSYKDTQFDDLADMRLRQIKKRHVQAMIDRWAANGNAPKTILNKYRFFTAVMKHAEADPPRGVILPEKEVKEIEIPEDADISRALFYLRTRDVKFFMVVVLAATVGLRRSELCALELTDFDFKACEVDICKAMVQDEHGAWVIKGTKTKSGKRRAPLSPLAISTVQQYGEKTGPVIGLNPNQVESRWQALKRATGIPGTFHGLRHYKCSVMVALNTPASVIKARMGHATMDMIDRVYSHVIKSKDKAVAELENEHDDALLDGRVFDWSKQYLPQNSHQIAK